MDRKRITPADSWQEHASPPRIGAGSGSHDAIFDDCCLRASCLIEAWRQISTRHQIVYVTSFKARLFQAYLSSRAVSKEFILSRQSSKRSACSLCAPSFFTSLPCADGVACCDKLKHWAPSLSLNATSLLREEASFASSCNS